MANEYDLSDLGGHAMDLTDLGGVPSGGGGAQPQAAKPGSLRDLALALAHHIFLPTTPDGISQIIPEGMRQVIDTTAQGLKAPVDAARGAFEGLRRQDAAPDASLAEKVGAAAGRGAPAMAGALAAGAATGGLGLIPAAAAVGAGAAGGDLFGAELSRELGGNTPDSVPAALKEAGKTGLETAATELGLGVAAKAVKAVAPRLLQSLQIVPAESLKRMIDNSGEVLQGGKLTQTGAELRGGVALRNVQKAVEAERTAVGREVETALNGFDKSVGGKPVIDATKAFDRGAQVLRDAGVGNAAVDAALPASEVEKVTDILNQIAAKPNMTPVEAVQLRRAIDNLTAFKKGGVPQVASEVGEKALAQIGAGLRESIGDAAKTAGYKQLAEANAKASRFFNVYDGVKRDIGTKLVDSGALKDKLAQIAGKYNNGGVDQGRLVSLAQIVPSAAKDVKAMLDYATAREFLLGVKKTPSGVTMSAVRAIFPALGIAKGLPAAQQGEAIAKVLARAGVASAASSANQREGQP